MSKTVGGSIASLESLAGSLHPQRLLRDLAPGLSGVLDAHRIGVAISDESAETFRNVALWDHADDSIAPGSIFHAEGTAASWVSGFSCPLAGRSLSEMERYPSTLAYLVRERFSSNLLLPLDVGSRGRAVLYVLSRKSGTFTSASMPVGMRVREVVEPALKAYLATRELIDGGDEVSSRRPRSFGDALAADQSLDGAQRRHILDVLTLTNGVIEGARGAAAILRLRPSTLRNRMRKLGIERRNPESQ